MPHEVLKNPRHGCDLHGALQTIEALAGVVPIVHANAGCVYQNYLANKASHLAEGTVYGPEIPATEVIEKQVVFGGASRLREEIKNAVKTIDGKLYIILGSCEAAMVGDDLAAMAKEATDINLPVIIYPSAGFRGGSHWGYQNLMKAIIRQLPSVKTLSAEKIRGMVNVLGILPKTDPFYKGDAQEIKRLLSGAGIQPNIFFDPCGGINDLEQSSRAEHTLVFSHWGIAAARQLEELYGTPYTVFDSLPLGMEEIQDFFTKLSSLIDIDSTTAQEFLRRENIRYSYYLRSLADTYYTHALQKTLAIIGDTSTVIRLGTFLRKCLGAGIRIAIITDGYAHGKDAEKPNLPDGIAEEVFTTGDSEEIEKIISATDAEMILGSALEESAAKHLEIPHLTVSSPAGNRILLHKTYTGIEGVFSLLEDYAQAVTQTSARLRTETRRRLEALNIFNPRA